MIHLTRYANQFAPVSSCLHPRRKRVFDSLTHEWKTITYPCGKCWNCIHSFREGWRIRLYESMLASRLSPAQGFIYDTFTLSPEAMPSVSAFDYFTGESLIPFEDAIDAKVSRILEHYGNRIPFLPKETFTRFFKVGRELYRQHYGKCPVIRYFAALEYGPLWARPHIHLCVFGVNRADWVRFWAKRWRRDFGFTKTKFIGLTGDAQSMNAHCSRVSMYISKYLMKGSEDNILCKRGIVPPAWRAISHGIGEELLTFDFQHRFDWLLKDVKYWMANRVPIDGNSNSEAYNDALSYAEKFCTLLPTEFNSLKLYTKDGYNYALPRYYIDRLCAVHRKGIAGHTIKIAISQNAFDDCFEKVVQYATDCNYFPRFRCDSEKVRKFLGDDLRAFNFCYFRYLSFKRNENVRKAEWHRLSSLNQYKRLRAKPQTGDLGLLL